MSISSPPALSASFAELFTGRLALPWEAAPAPAPELVVLGEDHARELGLDPEWLRSPEGVAFLIGAAPPSGATPVAQCYAGHQFGGYSPRLGDGRALLLGELVLPDGSIRDLHLKGSGRTPFARGGDGLAALGPMLREYVISEFLHAAGIPTTRALAVLTTGREIYRAEALPGALLVRSAASHIRVGSFQYAAATGDLDLLRDLADHAITRHYPADAEAENPYLALLSSVVEAQASLVAKFSLLGFVHGVLNTDNVTISGESIDYGPCAFMDVFDPQASFSSIDHDGRYAYGNQPGVMTWNLARLAEALLPLLDEDSTTAVSLATETIKSFPSRYEFHWLAGMRAKLGLGEEPSDTELAELTSSLLALLAGNEVDYTGFFRALSSAARGEREPARSLVLDLAGIDAWLEHWLALSPDAELLDATNPLYIPRNHLVEEALAAATQGDLEPLHQLMERTRTPFTPALDSRRYAEPDPTATPYRTFCGT